MKIITNNNNNENIKIPSNLEFLHYGNGNNHPNDNFLIYDDNNMWIKSGDTFIAWGHGIIWRINGITYGVSYASGLTNQIINLTANAYTFSSQSSSVWVYKIK